MVKMTIIEALNDLKELNYNEEIYIKHGEEEPKLIDDVIKEIMDCINDVKYLKKVSLYVSTESIRELDNGVLCVEPVYRVVRKTY